MRARGSTLLLLDGVASGSGGCNQFSGSYEIDGGALRTYRHAPNTGSRKSWAAGDATSRGVRHALIAMTGEMGYPSALSASRWGFYDVLFGGKPFTFPQGYGSYVMENVLFKISFPAEFHAQTAVECAMELHDAVAGREDQIKEVVIEEEDELEPGAVPVAGEEPGAAAESGDDSGDDDSDND